MNQGENKIAYAATLWSEIVFVAQCINLVYTASRLS